MNFWPTQYFTVLEGLKATFDIIEDSSHGALSKILALGKKLGTDGEVKAHSKIMKFNHL